MVQVADAPRLAPFLERVTRPRLVTRTPRLSIVIVNYAQWENTAALVRQLRRCASVRNGVVEIVIVDNHSPRHKLMRQLRRCEGVSLRRWGRNRGFARAVNEGTRLSRGDWFLLLNPDVSVNETFIEGVAALAARLGDAEPRTGIVGFHLRNGDGSLQLSSGGFPTLAGTLAGLTKSRAQRKYRTVRTPRRCPVPWVTGCCLLVRRACWHDLGGFAEDFFLYYEDVDLCRRARKRGWGVCYEPNLQAVHHSPIHARAVPPAMRLITRHSLLTYGARHWPRWQLGLMCRIVRAEAWVRRLWARWRGDKASAQVYDDMAVLAADLARGQTAAARQRLLHVVEQHGRSLVSIVRTPEAEDLSV